MYRMYVHRERHKDIYEYMEGVKDRMRGEILRLAVRLYINMQGNQLVRNTNHPTKLGTEVPAITHKITDALPFG